MVRYAWWEMQEPDLPTQRLGNRPTLALALKLAGGKRLDL